MPSSQNPKNVVIGYQGDESAGSNGSGHDPGNGKIAAALATDTPMDLTTYVIARYVADFGNVVKGFSRTKAFRVVNMGKVKILLTRMCAGV